MEFRRIFAKSFESRLQRHSDMSVLYYEMNIDMVMGHADARKGVIEILLWYSTPAV